LIWRFEEMSKYWVVAFALISAMFVAAPTAVYAEEDAEAKCKAEAAAEGVSAEDMKSYVAACVEAMSAEKAAGSGSMGK
jgi:hypothetical protein